MSHEFCVVRREGPVTIVELNRPAVMNALHFPANHELEAVFDAFESDPDQWLAIVTGAGDRAFCAGNDLKATPEQNAVGLPRTEFGGLTARFDGRKPIIAAVNGVAMGGGFELALACDLIVASENAVFALPEGKRGLFAGGGGPQRLAREIGVKRAMEIVLTGRTLSSREGLELGFVNEVVPAGEALAAARRLADALFECAPLSSRAHKQLVHRGFDAPSLEQAMAERWDLPAVQAARGCADAEEGVRAFREKRAPRWQGR